MVFGHDILGTEGFEIIEKNWEKFVKVVCFFAKVGGLFVKVGGRLRNNWQNSPVFGFFGKISFEVWSWGVVNISGINFH